MANKDIKSLGFTLRKAPQELKPALYLKSGKKHFLLEVPVNVIEGDNFVYLSSKAIVGVFNLNGTNASPAVDKDYDRARTELVPAKGSGSVSKGPVDLKVLEAQKKIAEAMKGLPEGYKLGGVNADGSPKIVKARVKKV